MKKTLLITFISLCFCMAGSAQNLVPNWSFEDTIACPTSLIQTNKAIGWIINVNSADYYNSCASNLSGVSVPKNYLGYQIPSTGNAYCGIVNYGKTPMGDVREYIGTRLSSQLIQNQKYFVSFKASWADGWCATNKLGVLFSNKYYGDSTTWGALIVPPPMVNNFAHIYSNSIITDSVNWTTISGSFVADSAYKYIYIGNFFKRENIDTLWFYGGLPDCKSYYYIDDICVSLDSLTCNLAVSLNEIYNENYIIDLYPNPTFDYININCKNSRINFINCSLFDTYGRLIKEYNKFIIPGEIDISSFPAGIYFLQIKSEYTLINKKIIIYKT